MFCNIKLVYFPSAVHVCVHYCAHWDVLCLQHLYDRNVPTEEHEEIHLVRLRNADSYILLKIPL